MVVMLNIADTDCCVALARGDARTSIAAQQSFLLESCGSCKQNRLQLCVLQGMLLMAGGLSLVDPGKKGLMVVVDVVDSLRVVFCFFGLET